MKMEKKKLLLVAISVGIFLVLTIGAALLAFTPKSTSGTFAVASYPTGIDTGMNVPPPPSDQGSVPAANDAGQRTNTQSAPLDPVELVRSPGNTPGLTLPPEEKIRQENDLYVNGAGRNTETVISVPKPSTAAVPDAPPAGRADPIAKAAPAPSTTTAAPPTSTPAQAPKPAAQSPAASTQTQPKPAPAQTRVYDDYWVQTGAFSTVARAEGVKETLESKGITSIIENREVNGSTFFRVRVGPYTSQNEANYWLSLIRSISGFEGSQVRQTQSRR